MRRVVVLQSNYIPWRGYFHQIQLADVFVFLDSVQYTSRDWRNRNRIVTPQGVQWLTVPVHGHRNLAIRDVQIDNSRDWATRHFRTLVQSYGRAPYFRLLSPLLEEVYLGRVWTSLSELNRFMIRRIAQMLGSATVFLDDETFDSPAGKSERLVHIVSAIGGTHYLTGPSARAYLDIQLFDDAGIETEFMHYPEYPDYPQFWNVHETCVSILDLLAHTGGQAGKYIWGCGDDRI